MKKNRHHWPTAAVLSLLVKWGRTGAIRERDLFDFSFVVKASQVNVRSLYKSMTRSMNKATAHLARRTVVYVFMRYSLRILFVYTVVEQTGSAARTWLSLEEKKRMQTTIMRSTTTSLSISYTKSNMPCNLRTNRDDWTWPASFCSTWKYGQVFGRPGSLRGLLTVPR